MNPTKSYQLNFKPWECFGIVDPGSYEFTCGSCTGLVDWDSEKLRLIAIINTQSKNGDTQICMDALEAYAKNKGLKIQVVEIWNNDFYRYLITKRGYKDISVGESHHAEKSFN